MIKVFIGTQNPGSTIIKRSDKAIITSELESDAINTLIRMIQQTGVEINADVQNLLNRLSNSDITTYTDYLCLVNYLQRYHIGISILDVVQENGEEVDSSLSVIVVNTNGVGMIKPAVIYHTNANDVDMISIFEDTKERYRLYPDSIFPDADMVLKLESAKELRRVNGVINQNDKDDLALIFSRLGFKVYFMTH